MVIHGFMLNGSNNRAMFLRILFLIRTSLDRSKKPWWFLGRGGSLFPESGSALDLKNSKNQKQNLKWDFSCSSYYPNICDFLAIFQPSENHPKILGSKDPILRQVPCIPAVATCCWREPMPLLQAANNFYTRPAGRFGRSQAAEKPVEDGKKSSTGNFWRSM